MFSIPMSNDIPTGTARIGLCESMFLLPKYKKLCRVSCRVLEYSHFFSDADCMQLLRQPDAQPYEIVRLPENPLRHLTHCDALSFFFVRFDQNFVRQILCDAA